MKKLIRKISRYKEGDIQFILQKLSEINIPSSIENIENNTIILNDEEIKIIKCSLIFFIEEDNSLHELIGKIVEEDNRTYIADPLGANETIAIVAGIGVLGTIANNLIKAKFPNKEINRKDGNEKIIERDYSSISNTFSSLSSLKNDKNK